MAGEEKLGGLKLENFEQVAEAWLPEAFGDAVLLWNGEDEPNGFTFVDMRQAILPAEGEAASAFSLGYISIRDCV